MPLAETARAKVNLSLRVLGRRPDGYHELASLVAFAVGAADTITLSPGGHPGLEASGPNASSLRDGQNLVLRAVEVAKAQDASLVAGRFRLEKRLPVAAGIGGGSADAAAALRLLRRANPSHDKAIDWLELAASIGADVPVCMEGRAAIISGRGEQVSPLSGLPPVWAVLANPRVPLATPQVFRALSAAAAETGLAPPQVPSFPSLTGLIAWLSQQPNDLEETAVRLCPPIERVRTALSELSGARLARMSGSGPTCFALFGHRTEAEAGARRLRDLEPGWWVAATSLR